MKEILGFIALTGIGVFFYTKYHRLRKKRNVKVSEQKVELETN